MSKVAEYIKNLADLYEQGSPLVSDSEYDALVMLHGEGDIGGAEGDIPHLNRLYSLQKHYDIDGDYPFPVTEGVVQTPKLDGLAVSLTYVAGSFVQALTRGNGIKGKDVTENLKLLVPSTIPCDSTLQIVGEVVALKSIPNSRNFAAGAVNLHDIEEFKDRILEGQMKFIAYNSIFVSNANVLPDFGSDMEFLITCGLDTVLSDLDFDLYPQDGVVFRINNNSDFQKMGFTSKFPKGAFAHKEVDDSYQTTLLDVVWSTGKSGRVSPVAILEPIVIDGATISRATLNNQAYIESLDLELGCLVNIVRAGSIIPKITGRAD